MQLVAVSNDQISFDSITIENHLHILKSNLEKLRSIVDRLLFQGSYRRDLLVQGTFQEEAEEASAQHAGAMRRLQIEQRALLTVSPPHRMQPLHLASCVIQEILQEMQNDKTMLFCLVQGNALPPHPPPRPFTLVPYGYVLVNFQERMQTYIDDARRAPLDSNFASQTFFEWLTEKRSADHVELEMQARVVQKVLVDVRQRIADVATGNLAPQLEMTIIEHEALLYKQSLLGARQFIKKCSPQSTKVIAYRSALLLLAKKTERLFIRFCELIQKAKTHVRQNGHNGTTG